MRSRPEIVKASKVKIGSHRDITHASEKSRPSLANMAKESPRRLAKLRWPCGNRFTSIDRKIILSIPRTISKAVKVPSATHASGEAIQSNIL